MTNARLAALTLLSRYADELSAQFPAYKVVWGINEHVGGMRPMVIYSVCVYIETPHASGIPTLTDLRSWSVCSDDAVACSMRSQIDAWLAVGASLSA